jgi:hypothetical protein
MSGPRRWRRRGCAGYLAHRELQRGEFPAGLRRHLQIFHDRIEVDHVGDVFCVIALRSDSVRW